MSPAPAWERASRAELALLAIYFFAVVLLTDLYNIRLGVEALILTVLGAAVLVTRKPLAFARDWWVLILGMVMWNLSGPVAAGSPFPWHLTFLLDADRLIGFGHDPVIAVRDLFHAQSPIGPLDYLTSAAYNLHLPEPFIAAYFLWRLDRQIFFQFVAATLVLLVIGMIVFIFVPAVPPWMAGQPLVHFRDQYLYPWIAAERGFPGGLHAAWQHAHVYLPGVVNGFGLVLQNHPFPLKGSPIFYIFKLHGDPVAAFPSEHAAFPFLEFLVFRLVAPRFAWFLLAWIAVVLFTIIYLGEHWVTDALAGYVLALVAFGIARMWATARATVSPSRP